MERFIPSNYSLITETPLGVVYGDDTHAVFYRPKQIKTHTWHYHFKDIQSRDKKIADTFASLQGWEDRKKEYKAQKKNELDAIQIGDILYHSWGYEQTNIDFYQVIAKTKGTFTMQAIADTKEYEGQMHGTRTPLPGQFIKDKEPIVKRSLSMEFGYLGKTEPGKKHNFSEWA